MTDEFPLDLKILRALNQAQIQTLAEQGDSPDLFRAQVVEKILADDQCFEKMQYDEMVDVLLSLGFTDAAAREHAEKFKPHGKLKSVKKM